MRPILATLSLFLAASPARAAGVVETPFSAGAAQIQDAVQTAQRIEDRQAVDKFYRLMQSELGWYGDLERQPGVEAAQVSQAVAAGLKAGTWDSVVFGESHGNTLEQEAARLIIVDILGSGVAVGAFSQEAATMTDGRGKPLPPQGIFQFTQPLADAKIPIALFNNQFDPEKDVNAALKTAGDRVVITYTGSAHTSELMRDYIIKTLKESDLSWGSIYPGRPVIEQSLLRRHRKPVFVAMVQESQVAAKIQGDALREASKGVKLAELQGNIAAAQAAWSQVSASFQLSSGIRFRQASGRRDFYLGIAPVGRLSGKLEAAAAAVKRPQLAQWLGNKKVKRIEVGMATSSPCQPGARCCVGYQITVDKGSKDPFQTDVCLEDLP